MRILQMRSFANARQAVTAAKNMDDLQLTPMVIRYMQIEAAVVQEDYRSGSPEPR